MSSYVYKKMGIQTAEDYASFIKCGEILKSPLQSCTNSIILKCLQCTDVHLLLESFITHIQDHFKEVITLERNDTKIVYENAHDDEMGSDGIGIENPSVKVEELEDPLTMIKHETDVERSFIKIEPTNVDGQDEDSKNFEIFYDTKPSEHQDKDDCIEDVEDIGNLSGSQDESKFEPSETEDEKLIQKPSNTKGISSSFVSTFMKSEESLTAFIAAFRDQPQLWNKEMIYFANNLKRRESMIKIAEDLKMNHNIIINDNQVSGIMAHLYRKYRDYMQKKYKYKYVKPWYQTQLSFIEPYLENYSLEILDSTHPVLSTEQIVQILKIYHNLPHLWNSNLIENHCKNKRHESIVEMLNQLETTMSLKINENLLEQYLRTIHNNFSREKRQILNLKKLKKADNIEQSVNNYYKHLNFLYDHVPPLRCTVCGADSISPLHFKIHTSNHDGTLPFTCSQCHKEFKGLNVYTTHAKRHFQDLNHICQECNKKFVSYTNLRLHMRIHTGDKPYCCEICGDSFRFQQRLNNHRRRHEKRYVHTCKICSQGFYTKMRYDDHMNSHNNIRSHICEICNKAFITKRAVKRHKAVHEDVRNHACKLCGKTFKRKTGLNQHMMKTHHFANTEEKTIF